MAKGNVSLSVIRRLPRYHRFLRELLNSDTVRISSSDLSEKMGLTASQIRQDLNCFGGFGQQGYGYNVKALYDEISKILGLGIPRKAILLGAGNLGKAVIEHMDFTGRGLEIIGIFDIDKRLVGQKVADIEILDSDTIADFCDENKPTVAILCIPKESAIRQADILISHGIKAFWNFSHYDLTIDYDNIAVENVHLGDSLSILCYKVKELENN